MMWRRRKSYAGIVFLLLIILWAKNFSANDIAPEQLKENLISFASSVADKWKTDALVNPLPNLQSSVSTELTEADFVRVVDGDTIVVNVNGTEEKIRFLSVNTPESVSSDESKNNIYGEMASQFTKDYFTDVSKVWLQYDTSKTDQYGRTLAYVWIKQDVDVNSVEDIGSYMYNAILVENGQAKVVIYEPNHSYKEHLTTMEIAARANKIGLWQYEEFANL